MPSDLTIGEIFERHAGVLGLEWRLGRTRAETRVGAAGIEFPSGLVGHPNPLRPHPIEVLGRAENEHLARADADAAEALAGALFAAGPACLVVAGGVEPHPAITTHAEAGDTPLVLARAPSERVVETLRHFLVTRLAKRATVHGVFIEVLGVGVLLTGAAGIGKSELALELVCRGHRLVADDAPEFYLTGPDVVEGSCPEEISDFMEVRGLGLVNVRLLFGETAVKQSRRLRLVVNLAARDPGGLSPQERLEGIRRERRVLGVGVPEVTIPVAPGHDLAVLVECTVRNHILRMKGYDPVADFEARRERLRAREGGEVPERP